MLDELDDELNRLSAPLNESLLTGTAFSQPIEVLLSKRALMVEEGTPLAEAIRLMRERGYGAVTVTRQGRLTGIITERDLVTRVIGIIDDFLELDVRQVMTPNPLALQRNDPLAHVVHNMHVGGYRHVPVVDAEGRPVSIVSTKDVVRFLLSHFPGEVANTVPEPFRGQRTADGG